MDNTGETRDTEFVGTTGREECVSFMTVEWRLGDLPIEELLSIGLALSLKALELGVRDVSVGAGPIALVYPDDVEES